MDPWLFVDCERSPGVAAMQIAARVAGVRWVCAGENKAATRWAGKEMMVVQNGELPP
jgi:hypothetical protein